MVQKSDPYLKIIDKHWNEIVGMYLAFRERGTIIEFDPNTARIIAYPAMDYLNGLTNRTKDDAKKVYCEAQEADSIMLFVRDEKRKVLRSYIFSRSDVEEFS
jgi:hypothetical protein